MENKQTIHEFLSQRTHFKPLANKRQILHDYSQLIDSDKLIIKEHSFLPCYQISKMQNIKEKDPAVIRKYIWYLQRREQIPANFFFRKQLTGIRKSVDEETFDYTLKKLAYHYLTDMEKAKTLYQLLSKAYKDYLDMTSSIT